jgi:hypothetical protein
LFGDALERITEFIHRMNSFDELPFLKTHLVADHLFGSLNSWDAAAQRHGGW